MFNFCTSISIVILLKVAWKWNENICPSRRMQNKNAVLIPSGMLLNYKENEIYRKIK